MADVFKDLRSQNVKMRVVAHRPGRRLLLLGVLALIVFGAAVAGFLLGNAKSVLDLTYLAALQKLDRANTAQIFDLKSQLVDAELSSAVGAQTASQLRENIKELRDETAALKEEVIFYKSLMVPSSIERGLQIEAFELSATDEAKQFNYHILLTQVEARRDWIQGDVRVEVRGTRGQPGSPEYEELVLSLTEIADSRPYPLRFRFRYFQDLSGMLTLPVGFLPEAVVVTAMRRGGRSESPQRTFEWVVTDET